MSAGQHVAAEIHYELNTWGGAFPFWTSGDRVELSNETRTVIVRVVTSHGSVISRDVVGLVGSTSGLSTNETMNLREFVLHGGRLRLGNGMRP